ncbi:hypothetical protein GP486_005565 [Trichoglossum hirsutum]|uniref:NACHT domain-containing protein n=1 Tax=Trichoglossum hirsutum TaxID=265104 RepID=A0A9P8RMH0_9PEZI|nr:hypothetical protein GP486_005565 [Trichoglossum hirsutum]
MLGRLQMTIEECIKEYKYLAKKIFVKRKRHSSFFGIKYATAELGEPWFDAGNLEKAVKDLLKRKKKDEGLELKEDVSPKCKVNYKCTIWEAARATSAAPIFFKSITLNDSGATFVDGGIRANNPIEYVMNEAHSLWPDRLLGCIVSIGAGWTNTKPLATKSPRLHQVLETLSKIASDANTKAREFGQTQFGTQLKQSQKYFRFHVEQGIDGIDLTEWEKMPWMDAVTQPYLVDKSLEIVACGKSLAYPTGATSQHRSDLFIDVEFQKYIKDFKEWLSPEPFNLQLEAILEDRHNGTCGWILNNQRVEQWMNGKSNKNNNVIWVHGGPGSGKTVLAATIIQKLLEAQTDTSHVGYAFCSRRAVQSSVSSILTSLIWQMVQRTDLSSPSKDIIIKAYQGHVKADKNTGNTSDDASTEKEDQIFFSSLYARLLQSYDRFSLIIDGLDENDQPDQLIRRLLDTSDSQLEASYVGRVLVSQNIPKIANELCKRDHLIDINVSAARVQQDISLFLRDTLHGLEPRLGPEMEADIQNSLLEKANGMFLWAKLAISALKSWLEVLPDHDPQLLVEIHKLPEEMSVLYLHLLKRIFLDHSGPTEKFRKDRRKAIKRIFQWALWSRRALSALEIAPRTICIVVFPAAQQNFTQFLQDPLKHSKQKHFPCALL